MVLKFKYNIQIPKKSLKIQHRFKLYLVYNSDFNGRLHLPLNIVHLTQEIYLTTHLFQSFTVSDQESTYQPRQRDRRCWWRWGQLWPGWPETLTWNSAGLCALPQPQEHTGYPKYQKHRALNQSVDTEWKLQVIFVQTVNILSITKSEQAAL